MGWLLIVALLMASGLTAIITSELVVELLFESIVVLDFELVSLVELSFPSLLDSTLFGVQAPRANDASPMQAIAPHKLMECAFANLY